MELGNKINFVAFSSWKGHSGDWKIFPLGLELTTKDWSYKYYPTDKVDPIAASITTTTTTTTTTTPPHDFDKGPKVIQSTSFPDPQDNFSPEKLLTNSKEEAFGKNYWLLPDKETGKGFVLDFGSVKTFNLVELVNTHNAQFKDRSTNEFKVYIRYINIFFIDIL